MNKEQEIILLQNEIERDRERIRELLEKMDSMQQEIKNLKRMFAFDEDMLDESEY